MDEEERKVRHMTDVAVKQGVVSFVDLIIKWALLSVAAYGLIQVAIGAVVIYGGGSPASSAQVLSMADDAVQPIILNMVPTDRRKAIVLASMVQAVKNNPSLLIDQGQ